MSRSAKVRVFVLVVLFVVFGGLLIYSALRVRYSVSGDQQTEFQVLEKSLTHGVVRQPDGNFAKTTPEEDSTSEPADSSTGGKAKPCPT